MKRAHRGWYCMLFLAPKRLREPRADGELG
jgi:hypothetical protein